jgi:acyl transferase domain-containing protein
VGGSQNQSKWRGLAVLLLVLLGLTTALCTVFALVVTAAQAWSEHAQTQWPTVTARVQRCGVDLYNHNLTHEAYWIDCKLSYTVGAEDVVSHLHSRSTPAPRREISKHPAARIEQMQEWVDEHPAGTPIEVHYDPTNHGKAVLVTTDMPMGGPQTPTNLKLLGFFAGSCALLLAIARIAWPKTSSVRGNG